MACLKQSSWCGSWFPVAAAVQCNWADFQSAMLQAAEGGPAQLWPQLLRLKADAAAAAPDAVAAAAAADLQASTPLIDHTAAVTADVPDWGMPWHLGRAAIPAVKHVVSRSRESAKS